MKPAPNVLLIVVDSLRADAVFGDRIPTPHFDELAEQGAAFRHCISTASATSTAFASLLTGLYPPKHGVRSLRRCRLSSSVKTMPEVFGQAGYNTYAEVTGPLVPQTDIMRGFDRARHRRVWNNLLTEWREEFIHEVKELEEPWLMLLHTWEAHFPYRSFSATRRGIRDGYEAAVTATDHWLGSIVQSAPAGTLFVITGDHGEISPRWRWQRQLGRMATRARSTLATRKRFPFLDRYLSLLETGHGFGLYEELIRVPLLMVGPDIRPAVIDHPVKHVDVLPTLAELCGLQSPEDVDGRSVLPLLAGDPIEERPAYLEAAGVQENGSRTVAVRTSDWKLVRTGDRTPRLYKLRGTHRSGEKHDLYRRHRDVARHLEIFMSEVHDARVSSDSGMSAEEEAVVEEHLRALGYL